MPESNLLEIYVSTESLLSLRSEYALQSHARPNLILRAVDKIWPFTKSVTSAPGAAVGLDLFESEDARLRRAGEKLLEKLS